MDLPKTMKAMALFGANDIRHVDDKPVPLPGPAEVLVKIAACGICGTDVKILSHGIPHMPPFGTFTPGHEWVGTVAALGDRVDEFQIGDRVAVQAHHGCGRCRNCLTGRYTNCLNYGNVWKDHRATGMTTDGGFAEYAAHHVSALYKIPDALDFVDATYVTTLGTAFWSIDSGGGYLAGDTVLVAGPGPIGLSLVQVCKALRAAKIILAGTREERLALGRELGATHTVNVRECADPLAAIMAATGGAGCDRTFESAGGEESVNLCLRATKPAGTMALVSLYKDLVPTDLNYAVFNGIKITTSRGEGGDNCRRAVELLAAGAVDARKIMTHQFPLARFHEALDTFVNRKDGAIKVVVRP